MGEGDRGGKIPRLMTAEELSAELGIGLAAVYRLVRSGEIPTVRVGTLVRFLPEQVAEWLAKGGTKRARRRPKSRKVDVVDETSPKAANKKPSPRSTSDA